MGRAGGGSGMWPPAERCHPSLLHANAHVATPSPTAGSSHAYTLMPASPDGSTAQAFLGCQADSSECHGTPLQRLAALPAALATEAGGPSPLPLPPAAPLAADSAAAAAQLHAAMQPQQQGAREQHRPSLYLDYACHTNPVGLLGGMDEGCCDADRHLFMHPAPRRSTLGSSAASPPAASTCGDEWGSCCYADEELLPGCRDGASDAEEARTSQEGTRQDLDALTIFPNACTRV